MGRGRQKAKQTKVARELKYFSPNTDYEALKRELGGANGSASDDDTVGDGDLDDDQDDYADWPAESGR